MNLANLPKEQREQINEDKQRWLKANELLRTETRSAIISWLNKQPEEYREDMRRRLNIINDRNKRK